MKSDTEKILEELGFVVEKTTEELRVTTFFYTIRFNYKIRKVLITENVNIDEYFNEDYQKMYKKRNEEMKVLFKVIKKFEGEM